MLRRLLDATGLLQRTQTGAAKPVRRPALPPGKYIRRAGTLAPFSDAFSPAALSEAFERVRTNGGGAGPDRQTLAAFAGQLARNVATLSREILSGAYQPRPAQRFWVPKAGSDDGEVRPVTLLAVRDRVAQRAAWAALAPFYEARFLACSFGFREGLSTLDAIRAVDTHRRQGRHWVVDGDIRRCFETIDHGVLLAILEQDLADLRYVALIERWLGARILGEGESIRPSGVARRGASQGAVISPLLANVYLHAFDQSLQRRAPALVRYADDWLILCKSRDEALRALEDAERALDALRLVLHPQKTRITTFDDGFSFLGAFFVHDDVYWIKGGKPCL